MLRWRGLLATDIASWVNKFLLPKITGDYSKSVKASATLRAPQEPWIFCTSIYPNNELKFRKLRHSLSTTYDAVTEILGPDAFAVQVGVDFAINLNKAEHVTLNLVEELSYVRSSITTSLLKDSYKIEKIVHVYHGPVLYMDQSVAVESSEDFSSLPDRYKVCFTKPIPYPHQMEYRFAISTFGKPKLGEFNLRITDGLKKLTQPRYHEIFLLPFLARSQRHHFGCCAS